MATSFPSSLDSFTNPSASDALDSVSVPHADQHANINDAVEALQAKVGVDGSAVTSSLDYKVANQGLVLVKSQTVGSGVSSVTVSNAFSSTFDNYRVTLNNCDASNGGTDVEMILGSTTTGYYYANIYVALSSGPTRISGNNVSEFVVGKGDSADQTFFSLDLFGPNIAQRTGINGIGHGVAQSMFVAGNLSNSTQYTAFTIAPSVGTLTGGTIRVYGYNG